MKTPEEVHRGNIERCRAYYASHRSEIRDQRRIHYLVNRQKIIDRAKKWVKDNPLKHRAYKRRHLDKIKARNVLNHAIAAGKINRKPCSSCKTPKAQAHHTDYDRPLDVQWLCAACHSAEHRGIIPLHRLKASRLKKYR